VSFERRKKARPFLDGGMASVWKGRRFSRDETTASRMFIVIHHVPGNRDFRNASVFARRHLALAVLEWARVNPSAGEPGPRGAGVRFPQQERGYRL